MLVTTLLTLVPFVAAFPAVMQVNDAFESSNPIVKRTEPPPRQPKFKSGRQNTGVLPPLSFDAADQFVDVRSGSGHVWKAPGPNDLRGQCPGLNAAANHGFIPHNGLVSIQQTITGLAQAYNMSPDLALFLAVVSIGLGGDPVKEIWSIGESFPNTLPFPATGIAGTHNQYESDASIVKGDAYLNGGNVGVFQFRSWENFYNMATQYTLDHAAAQSDYVTRWSILNNPYYFSAPFAGLVAPAAHNFVINFMSNRSAANPGGVLTRSVLKTFFAVTGNKNGQFVHNRGMERIPENWYKRPTTNQYNIPEVLADVFVNNAMYPGIVRFGGNTGKVNSFVGVDVANFTGGVFNAGSLAENKNAATCFFLQAAQQGLPDATDPLLGAAGSIAGWVASQLAPLNLKFGCPALAKFDESPFNQFPGFGYKGTGKVG